MPLLTNEGIALVFDVGKLSSSDSSFFNDSKKCLSRIFERKIFLHSKDKMGLILTGSDASEENYNNVSCPFALQLPTWDMVRFVRNELQPTDNNSDWLNGVVFAVDKLSSSPLKSKKIVVISNFASAIDVRNEEMIIEHLKKLDLTMTFIGPNELTQILGEDLPIKRAKLHTTINIDAKKFLINLREELGEMMELSPLDLALQHLAKTPAKEQRSSAWNSELTIGDAKIPISAYIKTRIEVKNPETRTKAILADEGSVGGVSKIEPTSLVKKRVEKHYVNQEGVKVIVSDDEILKGVKYGNTRIPYSDADKLALSYKPGEKGLCVISFTKLDKLNRMFIIGNTSHVVVAPQGSAEAVTALSALIQALKKTNCAAVARKVYSMNRGIRLVLLSPIREEYESAGKTLYKECLVMNDLTWKEGIKHVNFPNLVSTVTEKQQKAMDEFVDAKNLMTADRNLDGEPMEAFKIENTQDEKTAYYFQCLLERAVNFAPTLSKPSSFTSNTLKWPENLEEKLKNLELEFPITFNEIKKDKNGVFREKYLHMKELTEKVVPPPKLNHPKPVINDDDKDSVRDIKTLFIDDMLPPTKALLYTLKISVDSEDKPLIFATLKESLAQIHKFAQSVNHTEYNNWFVELFETAPDCGGIAEFFSSLKESYGSIGKPKQNVKEDANTPKPDALDIERSQLLMDIF